MARIVVRPHSFTGHINPTLGLAAALKARGHEVIYRVFRDSQPDLERRGFATVPLHPEIYPAGWVASAFAATAAQRSGAVKDASRRVTEAWMLGDELDELAALRPDAVLTDVFTQTEALAGHRLGVPAFTLETFPIRRARGVPPTSVPLAPSASPLELEAAAPAHTCLRDNGVYARISELHFEAVRFGYDLHAYSFDTIFMPALLALPSIILVPAAFGYAAPAPDALYFTPPLDTERSETVTDELARFATTDVLIYASLGTNTYRYPAARRLFETIAAVVGQRPAWRAVLHVGPALAADAQLLAHLPANVIAMARAPQLWLLDRATVFVTHGGINSAREAIERGTPMLVVPHTHDQPGNGARIEHHGAGLALPPALVCEESIARCLEALVGEHPRYRARVRALQAAIEAEDENARTLDTIEAAIAAAAPRAATPPPRHPAAPPVEAFRGWMFLARAEVQRGEPVRADDGRVHVARIPSDALGYGTGTWLARVEVTGELEVRPAFARGRAPRVVWTLDAAEELAAFAWACAELGFADDARVAELRPFFDQARAGSAAPAVLEFKAWLRTKGRMLWERGYEAAATTLFEPPLSAAITARRQAICFRAARAAGAQAGTREGAALFERTAAALGAELDDLLLRRLLARAEAQLGARIFDDEPALRPA